MKIRHGFVSNSSVSSFCLYGVMIPEGINLYETVIKEKTEPTIVKEKGCDHEFDREKCKFCAECGSPSWEEHVEEDEVDEYAELEYYFKKMGLEYFVYEIADEDWDNKYNYGSTTFVGINLKGNGGMRGAKKNPEKMAEVEKKLKELFPELEADFYSGQYAS